MTDINIPNSRICYLNKSHDQDRDAYNSTSSFNNSLIKFFVLKNAQIISKNLGIV